MQRPDGRAGSVGRVDPDMLTADRLMAAFTALGYDSELEQDDEIVARIVEVPRVSKLRGTLSDDMLLLRAFWPGDLQWEQAGEAVVECNEWNVEEVWPTASALETGFESDSIVSIAAEHVVLTRAGLTDRQLGLAIEGMLTRTQRLFARLDSVFPSAAPGASAQR